MLRLTYVRLGNGGKRSSRAPRVRFAKTADSRQGRKKARVQILNDKIVTGCGVLVILLAMALGV